MKTQRFSRYTPVNISVSGGTFSAKDSSIIDENYSADSQNIIVDTQSVPQKVEGNLIYGTITASALPCKGNFSWIAEDGVEYEVVACNGKIYWSNGNGTYTAVKFGTENVDIVITTATHYSRFIPFDVMVSGTQKKVVYMISDYNPITTTTAGTYNKYTAISRAIRLEVSSSTIIGKSVYYDNDNTRTPGADDVEIGQGSAQVGWPNKAKYGTKIFDRIVLANYYDDAGTRVANGWIASEAQTSTNWTNSGISANIGGGKAPDDFTGITTLGTSVLIFSRYSILNIQCQPGAISTWREFFLPTKLGCISNETITVHSDGWCYYMSEEGICRTDGRQAERVDLAIENQIKSLSQLKNNSKAILVSGSTSFDAGTPTSGDNLLDTTGAILKQKTRTLGFTPTVILNPLFEQSDAYWTTFLGTGGTVLFDQTPGALDSGKYASVRAYQTAVATVNVTDSAGTVLLTYHPPDSAGWVSYTIPEADLVAYIGTTIRLQFIVNTTYLITAAAQSFVHKGGQITFFYVSTVVDSNQYRHFNIDQIWTYYPITAMTIGTTNYDYGVTTPTSLGNLAAQLNTTIANATFKTRTSATTSFSNDWANIGTVGENGGVINSAARRYLQASITLGSPVVGTIDLLPATYVGAQWVSAIIDLGSVPTAYQYFELGGLKNSQTMGIEMNTSSSSIFATSDGYIAITDGCQPTNTLRQYIQYRVTFNTTDYTQIPFLTSLNLQYLIGSSGGSPCMYSYRDRLYCSLQEDGQTTNNITWVGTTKPLEGLKYKVSAYTSTIYPIWHKCTLLGANAFGLFIGKLKYYSSSIGKTFNMLSGLTNNGTVFTSYFHTKAFGSLDVKSIWRFAYIYSKSGYSYNIYFRTRSADDDWSNWSSVHTITASNNISKKTKWTFPGLVTSDFIQFKVESVVSDDLFAFSGLDVYFTTKAMGR